MRPDADVGFTTAMMADPVKHGAYLTAIGHCTECHAGWSRGVSDLVGPGLGRGGHAPKPPMAHGFYAGIKEADMKDIIAYLRTALI